MFKRIKNLLEISKYSVENLVNKPTEPILYSTNYPETTYSFSPVKPAQIINMHTEDPFKSFDNETPEQSPDDTTPRN